jgi:hypothetical protein
MPRKINPSRKKKNTEIASAAARLRPPPGVDDLRPHFGLMASDMCRFVYDALQQLPANEQARHGTRMMDVLLRHTPKTNDSENIIDLSALDDDD